MEPALPPAEIVHAHAAEPSATGPAALWMALVAVDPRLARLPDEPDRLRAELDAAAGPEAAALALAAMRRGAHVVLEAAMEGSGDLWTRALAAGLVHHDRRPGEEDLVRAVHGGRLALVRTARAHPERGEPDAARWVLVTAGPDATFRVHDPWGPGDPEHLDRTELGTLLDLGEGAVVLELAPGPRADRP